MDVMNEALVIKTHGSVDTGEAMVSFVTLLFVECNCCKGLDEENVSVSSQSMSP